MGNHHGEDEEEEEAVVPPADTPVEEKTVMVVFFSAHVTQLAVFGVVRLKQLRKAKTGLEREQNVYLAPSHLLLFIVDFLFYFWT